MIVQDTCVLSELGRARPDPTVAAWLASKRNAILAIPASAVVEIQRGAELVRPGDPAKAEALEAWLEGLLASGMIVLPMDASVGRVYGRMLAIPALRGFWVPDPKAKRPKLGQDLLIAATAIVHGATIASVNWVDFERIDRHFPLPGVERVYNSTNDPGAKLLRAMAANAAVENPRLKAPCDLAETARSP